MGLTVGVQPSLLTLGRKRLYLFWVASGLILGDSIIVPSDEKDYDDRRRFS